MIYPYKKGSSSAATLSAKMGKKQIKREGSKFKGHPDKVVINWGAKALPDEVQKCKIINKPESVAKASDKLSFFEAAQSVVQIPEFTTDVEVAREWSEKSCVLARTTLNGHSGEGIHILEDKQEFENFEHSIVRMYVKYIPKKDEYRVHVVGGEIVDIRRKALRSNVAKDHANWKVRNLNNGFIFAKEGVDAPDDVKAQSLLACAVIGLDFGAVDVIWNNFRQKAYVLEINTAPGLEGSTVDNYAEAFEGLCADYQTQEQVWGKRKSRLKGFGVSDVILDELVGLSMSAPQAPSVTPTTWNTYQFSDEGSVDSDDTLF